MTKYAFYELPLGAYMIGDEDGFIVQLERVEEQTGTHEPTPLTEETARQLREYFDGKRTEFDLPCKPHGTAFQEKVWAALCDIPYGQTRTYKDIAIAVGNPKACRAVGMANHNNPIGIVIPCHRVIGANGKLTGYAGGLDIKEALLNLERNGKKL